MSHLILTQRGPPKLGGPQLSRLYALIAGRDPRQMQFEFALWTREMIREVIRREFRVALSVVSVGRLLRKLGLSPQRPLHRAYQQDPDAVQRWKKEAYPAIRAEAACLAYFAYPEPGPQVGRTRGQTRSALQESLRLQANPWQRGGSQGIRWAAACDCRIPDGCARRSVGCCQQMSFCRWRRWLGGR